MGIYGTAVFVNGINFSERNERMLKLIVGSGENLLRFRT